MADDNTNLPAERLSYASVGIESSGTGGTLAPKTLGEVVAFAKVMARADLALPKHLRNNDGACMAVAMQAMRWEMDPFAVANKSYSVNDRLAFEAQLVAAVVHTRAPIKGRPNYIYSGEGPSRRCQVVCTMMDGEEREYTSPRFDQILTKNSPLWKSDPDQQMGYFAIRSWARRHTPEVILGVYTPDEAETMRNVTPQAPPDLKARLAARTAPATEGFSTTQAEDREALDAADHSVTHDAETGEIIHAEVQELETDRAAAAGNEGEGAGPGSEAGPQTSEDDGSSTSSQEPAGANNPAGGLTLEQRATLFLTRIGEAKTTVKLKSLYAAAADLRRDLDAKDPERLVEVDQAFNDRFAAVEDAEKAERQ